MTDMRRSKAKPGSRPAGQRKVPVQRHGERQETAPTPAFADLPRPYETLYESPRLLVINKPAGLASHAGPSATACVEDWFPLMSRRRDGPWLAHRLDTDTAGCLVIALRKQGLIDTQAFFAAGRVRKTYWAVVKGTPDAAAGEIDLPLLRVTTPGGWKVIADKKGKPARTTWRRLFSSGGLSLLELTLRTGRTHQARVHCATLGTPIVGDSVYGAPDGQKLHLLSRELHLPFTPPIDAIAPPPPHMLATLNRIGWQG
ncbi:RluA family pseudouridine synthase [Acetobacter nitrogenifigens]|uniref:RNA pseudouridine synthase n=1 Tax=Acetobacter nitrogenifigens DSM 23921 = NBRC 105050 TaxID=1120919 RepID=A0A511X681_9PROT|nr:RNA pseudouridine synthase [Acetobacter nitrogenifigens]GEN58457.1 RNA pseudouridine synthase [Acetobacter nitrogenifigens DSM 23921 = NBRC 105050]